MIPSLSVEDRLPKAYEAFFTALANSSFSGEIRTDFPARLVTATDNSIYQILPKAVLFPRNTQDVSLIFKLANEPAFAGLTFSPRGGGTGTNGQSLSPGIVIDCSKYMRQILEVKVAERQVRVQPGVIPDELNRELAPTGLFFAPDLSPSNRATIGGMINTDACGQGSRIYGKTSDHVLGLTLVMSDGGVLESRPLEARELEEHKRGRDCIGQAHRRVDEIVTQRKELIEETFPKMSRFLTGYDLAHVYDWEGRFNLHRIVCGSEGTLAIVTEAWLKLTPIPAFKGLVAVKYRNFNDALADAQALLSTDPAAIETVDEKILAAAREDVIWNQVGPMLGNDPALQTVNLVEFTATTNEEVEARLNRFQQVQDPLRLGFYTTRDPKEIATFWNLRKKGVGLLGNLPGVRRPIAFMEDTAVPPQNLAAYIHELRQLLNQHGLQFAMYGHVDVGCLHVRPALNMQDLDDERLVRQLSDEVVALVRKYGGVMWAEHGKGFRSEYTPLFFGETLYQELRNIKAAFDPNNKLNPGKVVSPAGMDDQVVLVEAPLRGHYDRQIPQEWQEQFGPVLHCNGNGACFNFDPHSIMCPSSKITSDRIHSPKGRAAMMREWLRRLSFTVANPGKPIPAEGPFQAPDPGQFRELRKKSFWPVRLINSLAGNQDDFSHQVKDAMSGCLSCKACATQCPINVDIPDFKARFLELYYARYLRKPRDLLVGSLEGSLGLQSLFPRLVNALSGFAPVKALIEASIGLVDAPKLKTTTLKAEMRRRGLTFVRPGALPPYDDKAVILIQDAFTCFYDCQVFWGAYDLLVELGFKPYVAAFVPNGKPLHIKGFLKKFRKVAQVNTNFHRALAASGIPLVGLEPSVVLTYRDEYLRILECRDLGFQVHLLQEWLVTRLAQIETRAPGGRYHLLAHCMEKTGTAHAEKQWQQIFQGLGLELEILVAGCCGMAGTYGHEREHRQNSEGIFRMSWGVHLESKAGDRVLATGFSCRSQTRRFAGVYLAHPATALLEALRGEGRG